jgi:hypothetical protein
MNIFPRITTITILAPLVASVVIVDSAFAQNTLSGRWLVVYDSTYRENWEIQIRNNRLSIVSFNEEVPGVPLPGDYRRPLSVENVTSNRQGIYLRVRQSENVVYEYQLSFVRTNRIQGVYRYSDRTLEGIGAIGGESGVVTKAGSIIMTRMQ